MAFFFLNGRDDYDTMRVAQFDAHGGVAHFDVFNGVEWRNAGYTRYDRMGYGIYELKPEFVGGDKVMSLHLSNMFIKEQVVTIHEGEKQLIRFNVRSAMKHSRSAYVYTGSAIASLQCGDYYGKYVIYCGIGDRLTPCEYSGYFTPRQPSYHDGIIYSHSYHDQLIWTDIPLKLVWVSPLKLTTCCDLGMFDGNMYTIADDILWCRDLRMGEPFSTHISLPTDQDVGESVIVKPGLILTGVDARRCIHIVDMRYTSAYYEIDYPPGAYDHIRLLRD